MGRFQSALTRLHQFRRALTAKVEPSDLDYLHKYLQEQERALFYQMDRIDQRHCLDVAHHAYQAATARGMGNQRALLVKAALLHDIGKVRGSTSLWTRILYVLQRPTGLRAKRSRWRGLNGHARRGAHMAMTFGVEPEVVRLIRDHHQTPSNEQAKLLQEADNLY